MKKTGKFILAGLVSVTFLGFVTQCSQDDKDLEIKCSCVPKTSSASEAPPQAEDPYLLTCIYNGDLDAVKKTVSKFDLDESKVPDAVLWAVKCNQAKILEWLLDNGWSTDLKSYDSPLAIACEQSCPVLKALLKKGAELNENHEEKHWLSDYKQSALHYAIRSGRPCLVKTALECGLDADPGRSYYPPLLEAVCLANKDPSASETICRLLVKYGADPDRKGNVLIWQEPVKLNPAEYLVQHHVPSSLSLLTFLLDHGADAEYSIDDIRAMATPGDIIENVNPVLKKNPHVREELLRFYLLKICTEPETSFDADFNEALLKALKDSDVDLNQPLPGQRDTPLTSAKRGGNEKLCEQLIRYGAKSSQ